MPQLNKDVAFLFGKLLNHIFYSDTLYSSLQKIAEKERKYKADQDILICEEVSRWNG